MGSEISLFVFYSKFLPDVLSMTLNGLTGYVQESCSMLPEVVVYAD